MLSTLAINKYIQMSDSKETVVMGLSDALARMPRFDGNESNVIWPEWRLDLKRRVTFECMLADLFTKNVNAVVFERLSRILTGAGGTFQELRRSLGY